MIHELQKALNLLFRADPTLMGMVKDITDKPFEKTTAQFPYIRFNDGTVIADDTLGLDNFGYRITMGFQVFDQNSGSVRTRLIQQRIHALLHGKKFAVGDLEAVADLEVTLPITDMSDNKTTYSVTRYGFIVA